MATQEDNLVLGFKENHSDGCEHKTWRMKWGMGCEDNVVGKGKQLGLHHEAGENMEGANPWTAFCTEAVKKDLLRTSYVQALP